MVRASPGRSRCDPSFTPHRQGVSWCRGYRRSERVLPLVSVEGGRSRDDDQRCVCVVVVPRVFGHTHFPRIRIRQPVRIWESVLRTRGRQEMSGGPWPLCQPSSQWPDSTGPLPNITSGTGQCRVPVFSSEGLGRLPVARHGTVLTDVSVPTDVGVL